MKHSTLLFRVMTLVLILGITLGFTYPIDGYQNTGIRRLVRLEWIMAGKVKDTKPVAGALKNTSEIKLYLQNERGDSLVTFPKSDPKLQKQVDQLFPNLDESYSMALLEITPGKPVRFAQKKMNASFMPGSVAKLAVAAGLFTELQRLYPDSFEKRQELLRNRKVKAERWCITNVHTVPFFNPDNGEFFKRIVQPEDVFSLYEWVDHMMSVSSNAAASVVWKEMVLMRAFGNDYPVSESVEKKFWATTPKDSLRVLSMEVVNTPMAKLGISRDDFWLGNLFTSEGQKMCPGQGGSKATPTGFLQYLIAIERGLVVDYSSSLEIKRLLYITDRRIRYAAAPQLANAALYFKSGSLYKCKAEPGFECIKYKGNVYNYMNSIAIVEHPEGPVYLVVLMSNVLRKNSATDHMELAVRIDKIIRG